MAITKVQYTDSDKTVVQIVYNNDTSIKRTTKVDNMENRDWKLVKKWIDEGNTIEEAD